MVARTRRLRMQRRRTQRGGGPFNSLKNVFGFGKPKPLPGNIADIVERTRKNIDTEKGFILNGLNSLCKEKKITDQQLGVYTIMINNSDTREKLRSVTTTIYDTINKAVGGRRSRRRRQRRY